MPLRPNWRDVFDDLMRLGGDSEKVTSCIRLLLSTSHCKLPELAAAKIDAGGGTLLHRINRKTVVSVVQLLLEMGLSVETQDQSGYTPLAIAIASGNEGVARCLIEHGAAINTLSPQFGSILHLACATGSLGLVKLLLNAGADPKTVHADHAESLLYTAVGIRDGVACSDMVRYLVDEAKVPINASGGRFCYPIIRAAILAQGLAPNSIRIGILQHLIRRQAKLDVADSEGRCAVHMASKSPWADSLRALVEAGAAIDVRDDYGRTPIHFAASANRSDCLEYLLGMSNDVDVNVADADNWTPLQWAAKASRPCLTIVSQLLDKGADLWPRGRACDDHNGTMSGWSALKLAKFTDKDSEFIECLTPSNGSDKMKQWDLPYVDKFSYEVHGPFYKSEEDDGVAESKARGDACTNVDYNSYLNHDYLEEFSNKTFHRDPTLNAQELK
ncbi:hypothetical protein TrVFT333_007387 [Trichoderma virens FT-333]|nr:hypothetical protein TrVFT333_007387 [Trichoderma virens FT-333]